MKTFKKSRPCGQIYVLELFPGQIIKINSTADDFFSRFHYIRGRLGESVLQYGQSSRRRECELHVVQIEKIPLLKNLIYFIYCARWLLIRE